jgi:hypothetical protein
MRERLRFPQGQGLAQRTVPTFSEKNELLVAVAEGTCPFTPIRCLTAFPI